VKDLIEILTAVGMILGAYTLILAGTKGFPKRLKPGRDFDERGRY
jgi:hypothetical protein